MYMYVLHFEGQWFLLFFLLCFLDFQGQLLLFVNAFSTEDVSLIN